MSAVDRTWAEDETIPATFTAADIAALRDRAADTGWLPLEFGDWLVLVDSDRMLTLALAPGMPGRWRRRGHQPELVWSVSVAARLIEMRGA